jgi:hypothetical protein
VYELSEVIAVLYTPKVFPRAFGTAALEQPHLRL